MGRVALTGAVGLTVVLASTCLAPAAPSSHYVCGPASGISVIEGRRARVYSLQPPDAAVSERILGCLRSGGRPRQLSPHGAQNWLLVETAVLHAPWAGGIMRRSGVDTHHFHARATNLRTGATVECEAGGGRSGPGGGTGTVIKKVLLAASGALVWSSDVRSRGTGESGRQVLACTAEGVLVLAASEGIDLASPQVHGSTVTWTDSGNRRTAKVP
jgi:hypothetical protein